MDQMDMFRKGKATMFVDGGAYVVSFLRECGEYGIYWASGLSASDEGIVSFFEETTRKFAFYCNIMSTGDTAMVYGPWETWSGNTYGNPLAFEYKPNPTKAPYMIKFPA